MAGPWKMRGVNAVRRDDRLLMPAITLACCALLFGGCAGRDLVLELHTSVMYEKPSIEEVSYVVSDRRSDGGDVVLRVTMAD